MYVYVQIFVYVCIFNDFHLELGEEGILYSIIGYTYYILLYEVVRCIRLN